MKAAAGKSAAATGRGALDDLQFWPRCVPIGALLVGVGDLKNVRFIERFGEQLRTDRQSSMNPIKIWRIYS